MKTAHLLIVLLLLLWPAFPVQGTDRIPAEVSDSRDWPEEGGSFSRRAPNVYRLRPLLSPTEIERQWKTLEDEHGKEKVKEARRLAGMLDRPNSRETTEGFIRCIAAYGLEATEKETRNVAKMVRHNPHRNVGTVIVRLRKKAGK